MYLSRQLKDSDELKDDLSYWYAAAAQYDAPPTYPVSQVCGGIDGAPNGTDILGRIFIGISAIWEDKKCHNLIQDTVDETSQGWHWQVS